VAHASNPSGHSKVHIRRNRWRVGLYLAVAVCCWYVWRAVWRFENGIRLISAIKSGQTSAAISLLRSGADPEAQSHTEEWSPLDVIDAGLHGRKYERFGLTALMLAAIGGNREVAEELLRRGARVNAVNNSGTTAMHLAVKYGRLELVRLLLAHGAEITLRDNSKESPVDEALRLGNPEIIKLFRH
jgi:hypothetical protein